MTRNDQTIELLQKLGTAYRKNGYDFDVARDARVRSTLVREIASRHPQHVSTPRSIFATIEAGLHDVFALRPAVAVIALFVIVVGAPLSSGFTRTFMASLLPNFNVVIEQPDTDVVAVLHGQQTFIANQPIDVPEVPAKENVEVVQQIPKQKVWRSSGVKSVAYAPSVGIAYAPSVLNEGRGWAESVK